MMKFLQIQFFFVSIFVCFAIDTSAANFTVNNNRDTSDSAAGNGVCADAMGNCTLRAAVEESNALSGNDEINFAASLVNATITLTIGNQITIDVNALGTLTINGLGADRLTIDGGAGANRIFLIDRANDVTITGVTLQGGGALGVFLEGGAILVSGNDGGSLILNGVDVRNNQTQRGAISFNVGFGFNANHRIINSTIRDNTSDFTCSGIYQGGGTLFVANTTISGNSVTVSDAFGGGFCNFGFSATTFRNSTITNNTAGVRAGGIMMSGTSLNLGNTIVAGNNAPAQPEIVNNSAAITSAGNNFIGDSAGDSTDTVSPITYQASDIRDQNPQRGALQNNGSTTPTHALLMGSAAINAGDNVKAVDPFDNSPLIADQRGYLPRTVSGTVDIGAYEFGAAPPQTDGNYQITQSVVAAGGGSGSGGSFDVESTIGQSLAGANLTGGSFVLKSGFWESAVISTTRKTPFDFDGDGKTDLAIFRPPPGEWWYLRSSDGANRAFQFGQSTDKIVPADYTGDGKTDIAIFRPALGEWFVLRSEDSSFYSFPFGISTDIPAPGDFDGDGSADPAVFRPSSATWFINQSSGGFLIITFGTNGDLPVVADYDGDGKSDIAIFRPIAGEWWIFRSQTSTTAVFNFGSATDKTVSGDYTGDGKADVAYFKPSTGEWFILRSENGSFYSFPFGAAGDIPALGDFDGDGKFDPTVFRPTSTNWFILGSTAGTIIGQFGATGDKPVPSAYIN